MKHKLLITTALLGTLFAPMAAQADLCQRMKGQACELTQRFNLTMMAAETQEVRQVLAEIEKQYSELKGMYDLAEKNYKRYSSLSKDVKSWALYKKALTDTVNAYKKLEGARVKFDNADQRYNELYPGFQEAYRAQNNITISEKSLKLRDNHARQSKLALASANLQIDNFEKDQEFVDRLMANSETAEGEQQILQAGNALMGRLGNELQAFGELVATSNNAKVSYMNYQKQVNEVQKEEAASELYEIQKGEKNAVMNRIMQIRKQ